MNTSTYNMNNVYWLRTSAKPIKRTSALHQARGSPYQQSIHMRLVFSTSHQYFGRGLLSWTEMKNAQQSQRINLR